MSKTSHLEVGVRHRKQAGVNAWINVEGVMMDRKLKGKVLNSCVVPAGMYGFETVVLTEQQQ